MVATGIAGDYNTVTCMVAAIDCLLDDQDIPYETYAFYREAFLDQCRYGPSRRRSRDVFREVLRSFEGSSSLRNFSSKRVTTLDKLDRILTGAIIGGKKIIICTSNCRVVGLRPVQMGIWQMVGNAVPYEGEITTEQILLFLYIPPRSIGLKGDQANIYLIN